MNARPTTSALAEPSAEPASPNRPSRVGPQLRFAAAGAVALALFVGTYLVFVTTETGQRIENLALRGAELRDVGERQAAQDVLSLVTLALFVLAVAGVFLAGLVLRRPGLGLAAAAIMVLSLAAAELMKALVDRPELAPGPAWILRNSFPSGTVTAASSMAVGVSCRPEPTPLATASSWRTLCGARWAFCSGERLAPPERHDRGDDACHRHRLRWSGLDGASRAGAALRRRSHRPSG